MKNAPPNCPPLLLAALTLTLGFATGCIDASEQDLELEPGMDTELDQQDPAEVPSFAEGESGEIDWDFGDGVEVRINYLVNNALVITGGDMVLGQVDEVRAQLDDRSVYGAFPTYSAAGWPDQEVGYYIDSNIGSEDRASLEHAIDVWEGASIFKFRRRYALTAGVVRFKYHEGLYHYLSPTCQSEVGYQGRAQTIWLTPKACTAGSIAHEIGHTLGLRHEHQRPDRDDHIVVNLKSVPWNKEANYWAGGVAWGDYNYKSIMHYSNSAALRVIGCAGSAGENAWGQDCNLRDYWPNAGDTAAVLRTNHGPEVNAFRFRNDSTGKCLHPMGSGSTAQAGDDVMTSNLCGQDLPSWYQSKNASGENILINKDGRVCLSAAGGISVQRCDTSVNIEFGLQWIARGTYQIKRGNLCLRDTGYLALVACANTSNQRWKRD